MFARTGEAVGSRGASMRRRRHRGHGLVRLRMLAAGRTSAGMAVIEDPGVARFGVACSFRALRRLGELAAARSEVGDRLHGGWLRVRR